MALGPTHYRWHPSVKSVVDRVLAEFPGTAPNTYVDHPWPGWDPFSIDFWGPGGRGDPIQRELGHAIKGFIMDMPFAPSLRHWIYLHTIWTSFGGRSVWTPTDHKGRLRHLHVTYWRF